jgi:hypothetical protein
MANSSMLEPSEIDVKFLHTANAPPLIDLTESGKVMLLSGVSLKTPTSMASILQPVPNVTVVSQKQMKKA